MSYSKWLEEKFQQQLHGEWFGEVRSFFVGSGIELSDPRQYQVGDSANRINRKLSAKHTKVYVNTYEEEHLPVVELFLDINKNWLTGIDVSNSDIVVKFLSDYALVAQKWHIKTHVHYIQDDMMTHRSLQGLDSWYQWLQDLPELIRAIAQQQHGYQSGLTRFFSEILNTSSSQSIVIAMSDFLECNRNTYNVIKDVHYLATIGIPISMHIGARYDAYMLSNSPSFPVDWQLG